MMFARRALRGSMAAALATAALCGCEDSKPSTESSTAEAKVTGTVKVHGKAMSSGEVRFNPANYKRPDAASRKATISKDGTYEITTLVGPNLVTVTGPEITREPQLGYAPQTLDVQSGGSNTLNIELPPAGQAEKDVAKKKGMPGEEIPDNPKNPNS